MVMRGRKNAIRNNEEKETTLYKASQKCWDLAGIGTHQEKILIYKRRIRIIPIERT